MKLYHSLQKLLAVAVCAVMMLALPSFSEARSKKHHKVAGKHSSKSFKTAKKSHKHKSKKTASNKHKIGKKSKIAKNRHSDRLPKGVVPPSRVRIIDTAGKNNPETFPMPETTDVGAVAASTKPASAAEEEFTAPPPEMQADAFTDLETQ